MRAALALLLCVGLAGCNAAGPALTPGQQAILDDLARVGARAACAKVESQYAKAGHPTALQAEAMAYVRMACADPAASVDVVKSAATKIIALLPVKG